jgi:hypothetical protein
LASHLYGCCRIFSKLDLHKGYLQVPVAAQDIANIAIITPFRSFELYRCHLASHLYSCCTIFSKLDLHKDYLQVPVAAQAIVKIAIITPFR